MTRHESPVAHDVRWCQIAATTVAEAAPTCRAAPTRRRPRRRRRGWCLVLACVWACLAVLGLESGLVRIAAASEPDRPSQTALARAWTALAAMDEHDDDLVRGWLESAASPIDPPPSAPTDADVWRICRFVSDRLCPDAGDHEVFHHSDPEQARREVLGILIASPPLRLFCYQSCVVLQEALSRRGIRHRRVRLTRPDHLVPEGSRIAFATHWVVEVLLPESRRWVMVDPNLAVVGAIAVGQGPLRLINVYELAFGSRNLLAIPLWQGRISWQAISFAAEAARTAFWAVSPCNQMLQFAAMTVRTGDYRCHFGRRAETVEWECETDWTNVARTFSRRRARRFSGADEPGNLPR